MNEIMDNLPLILPLVLIQAILAITALLHVLRHPNYRFGNKVIWILVVLFVQTIGPLVYFLFGRGEE